MSGLAMAATCILLIECAPYTELLLVVFSALSDCCIILYHHAIKVMLFIFQQGSYNSHRRSKDQSIE